MKIQTGLLLIGSLLCSFPLYANEKVVCGGEDLGQKYSVVCEVAYQGIDNDSSNYYKALQITQTECGVAKPSVNGNSGLALEFAGDEFRGGLQLLNDHAALHIQPKNSKPTYIRMAPEALQRPLTLQVSLEESLTDSEGNLIQDLSVTCRIQK